jgi:acetyl-CoA carboxylase carboxyl transferase subunit alpha
VVKVTEDQQEPEQRETSEREDEAREGWLKQRLAELARFSHVSGASFSEEIDRLQTLIKSRTHEARRHDTWLTVQIARHKDRPRTRDYIGYLVEGFSELKGDRLRADDRAIVGGIGWFEGRAVVVVGHQKGRTLNEQTEHSFGMARPEGYRKAQRLFSLAERHRLAVLTFVDTPGAYPGVAAEEGGQARAIAETMRAMARLTVPVVATLIGEGGSGGALALAVADRVLMQENATYSVITPEGCAAILWRDADFAAEAAQSLRPTASQLEPLGVIDRVVAEPRGGAHHSPEAAARRVHEVLVEELDLLEQIPPTERRMLRRERFRKLGVWGGEGFSP